MINNTGESVSLFLCLGKMHMDMSRRSRVFGVWSETIELFC